jgi:3-hydroxyacyl-CoA dehydrogenase/enoyl-CoA hydratase/3-hydroxybutyryl-CoA epimerase
MQGKIQQALHPREMAYGPLQASGPGGEARPWSHWQLALDEHQVAWLYFDSPGATVNLLSQQALQELGEILETVLRDRPKGLVLRSAKPAGFCVGADIREFSALADEAETVDKLLAAHAIANRLADLPFPTLAVIHGLCLGGGLELALCCDYRLAVTGARMGLPEILLGLHPGLGGTARLTHLIDPVQAMTLMLTGRTVEAREAWNRGLVDAVVPERHILKAVRAALNGKIARHTPGLKARLLTTRPVRRLAARPMRAKSAAKAPPEHYPAPEALIALWEEHGGDTEEMLEAEIRSFGGLLTGPTAQNLIRVFFLREKMKKLTRSPQPPLTQVHVIGAGTMGGDIAAWCAFKGLRVSLYDRQPEMVARAVAGAAALCRKKRLSKAATGQVLDRLIPDLHNRGIPRADLVIEAVPETVELKQQVYQEVEPLLKDGAVLATNTSSIPLQQLREVLADPGRLVGLHFFNPVAKMQLVEIVRHDRIDQAVLEKARAFVGQIDRLPAPVASAAGFLVNRVLTPYLMEAMVLLDEGLAAETIDRTAVSFGMPMGPVELADRIGLDICLSVAELLQAQFPSGQAPLPPWFRNKVAAGELGRKTGQGFYRWKTGKIQKKKDVPEPAGETLDRLLLPMLNACMACLSEGVIDDEDLLDGAVIFGTGFAPFWGGPMHYARSRGFADIAETLEMLAAKYGERFKPDPGWGKKPPPETRE